MQINNYPVRQNLYTNFLPKNTTQIQTKPKDTGENQAAKKKEPINRLVLGFSLIGAVMPVLILSKLQGVKNPCKININLKEMLLLGLMPINAGVFGGLLQAKNQKEKTTKYKEAVYQNLNILLPAIMVSGIAKAAKKLKVNKTLSTLIGTIGGVGLGMPLAGVWADKINNKFVDKENPTKRKIRIQDAFVHVDDLAGALAISKIPYVDHAGKLLPFIYANCAYETGTKK